MTTNRQLRADLADTLEPIVGLNVYRYPVDNIQTPAAIIATLDWTLETMDGGRIIGAIVQVLTSRTDQAFMERLDDLVDPNVADSVPDLISDSDIPLAVKEIGSIGLYEYAGNVYYGAPITLEVID